MFKTYIEIAVIIIFVIGCILNIYSLSKRAKINKNKYIETEAVISRIEEDEDPDKADSFITYAKYIDDTGKERESILLKDEDEEYITNSKVIIRYLPGEYETVKYIRKI